MKICVTLLLCYLAFSNGAISQIRSGNSFQRSSSSSNVYLSKTHTKANHPVSSNGKDDKILRNEMEMKNDGSYHYQYETSNGITAKEQGVGGVSVQGASSYISPEGVEIKMSYTADENGYHPVGDHIPKTPDYILRALEYIRTHPPKAIDSKHSSSSSSTSSSSKTTKLTTHIVPPTHKPAPRKVTPAPRRSNSFAINNKFSTTKNQYQQRKRF